MMLYRFVNEVTGDDDWFCQECSDDLDDDWEMIDQKRVAYSEEECSMCYKTIDSDEDSDGEYGESFDDLCYEQYNPL